MQMVAKTANRSVSCLYLGHDIHHCQHTINTKSASICTSFPIRNGNSQINRIFQYNKTIESLEVETARNDGSSPSEIDDLETILPLRANSAKSILNTSRKHINFKELSPAQIQDQLELDKMEN
jgi:hypothetical protein